MTLFNCWIVLGIYGLAVIGVTCTRLNVALQKTVYQSKTLDYYEYKWTADLAVDNKTKFTGDGCRCCAGVGYEYPAKGPWWEIDLGAPVKVGKVKVFGRKDEAYKMLYGFKMFVSETTPYNYSTSPYVYINNVTSEEYLANQGVTDVLFGDTPIRYIALALHRPRAQNKDVLMVVCEVQVFMPCDNYHFEPDCAQCHCDGSPCNKATGLCPGGCTPGWKGQRCDQKCDQGTFGVNCNLTCHCYSDFCDSASGRCPSGGCTKGYHGDKCDMVCGNNTYGKDCLLPCGHCFNGEQCDPVSGQCRKCAAGYQGILCQQTCPMSFYGESCSVACGHCYGDGACNHVTGICHSCAAGFHGELCISACFPGTYGLDCKSHCGNCLDKSACDITSGRCLRGCMPGYVGDHCKDVCSHRFYGHRCSLKCGNCYGNDTCDHVTGICQSCAAGYKGDLCVTKKICALNTYSVACVPCGHCLQGDACDIVTGFCPRGCETTHDGDHCTVPKAKVHAESVLIGIGVCLVGLALISGIVVGIRYALQRRQSVLEDHLAGESDVKGQSQYDKPAGASDMKGQSVYEQPARVSDGQDEHQYCSVVEYNTAAVSKY